jgi:hypothetical protein
MFFTEKGPPGALFYGLKRFNAKQFFALPPIFPNPFLSGIVLSANLKN